MLLVSQCQRIKFFHTNWFSDLLGARDILLGNCSFQIIVFLGIMVLPQFVNLYAQRAGEAELLAVAKPAVGA